MNTKSSPEIVSNSPEESETEPDVVGSELDTTLISEELSSEQPNQSENNGASLVVNPEQQLDSPTTDSEVSADEASTDSDGQHGSEPGDKESDLTAKSKVAPDPEEISIPATEITSGSEKNHSPPDVGGIIEQIEQLSDKLNKALDEGQLKDCISLHEKIQAKLKRLADLDYDSKKLKKIRKRINSSYLKVRELKDWRHWGIEQSRLKLISNLEGLENFEGDPMHLHRELNDLRKTWNDWIHSGDFPNRVMRERYANAYEKAFKPCKAYFKKQKKQRKSNKKLRKQICRDLQEFFESINWNEPDWSAVSESIRTARNQWKKAVPLTKKDWNATNARLNEIIGQFEPYLERERKRGLAFRQELIEIAESLDSETVKVATQKVKELQRDWKTVVIRGKKKEEHALWNKFHTACDRQFQRRNEIRKFAETKRLESTKTKKELLSEIQKLNEMPVEQARNSESKASEIRRKWTIAAKSTGKSKGSLDHQFNQEVSKFQENIRNLKRQEAEAALSVLESKANLCDEIELEAIRGECESDISSYRSRWDGIEDSCGEFEDAIRGRFESACVMHQNHSGNGSNLWQDNLEAKQDICLKLEILLKIDSPPEFAHDRMQVKIARLKTAMVDQNSSTDPEIETRNLLVNYWLTGAVPEHEYESLSERFNQIRNELSKGS